MTTTKVADQGFSLRQWFAGGTQSRGLRKPGCGHCYLRFFVVSWAGGQCFQLSRCLVVFSPHTTVRRVRLARFTREDHTYGASHPVAQGLDPPLAPSEKWKKTTVLQSKSRM